MVFFFFKHSFTLELKRKGLFFAYYDYLNAFRNFFTGLDFKGNVCQRSCTLLKNKTMH